MRTHRPLLAVVFFFGLGIIAQHYFTLPFQWWWIGAAALIAAGFVCMRTRVLATILICLSFAALGGVRAYHYQTTAPTDISMVARYYRGQPVMLEGVVASDVTQRAFFTATKTVSTLKVARLKTKWGWRDKTGIVMLNVFRDTPLRYGDYVRVEGTLHEPFDTVGDDTFSYKEYLRRRGIRLIISVKKKGLCEVLERGRGRLMKAVALDIKNKLKDILATHLTANEAGIMQAILLGDRSNIPAHIRELFIRTGTAHILAISGLHVGIVAFLLLIIFTVLPVRRKAAYVFTVVFLIFYAFLTGGRPSVVRATIMATVILCGFVIEREADVINSLSLAALIILLFNPLNIFDVGFQLSFVSVAAIILVYPLIRKRMAALPAYRNSRVGAALMTSGAISLAAWVGVAGLIAYYFRIITPITVFANLAVIPCISVVITLGFWLLLAGAVCGWCAALVAYCVKGMLSIMVATTYILSRVPGAYFYLGNVSSWHAIGYYCLLIILFIMLSVIKLTKQGKYGRVNPMKKIPLFIFVFLFFLTANSYAFWMWTPETNKWVNPKYAVKDTPAEQLEYALEFYNTQEYAKATRELNKLIQNYPRAVEAAEAQFYLGMCLEQQGELFRAYQAYQKVIEKYPFSERSAEIVEKQYHIGEQFLEGNDNRNKLVTIIVGREYDVVEIFRTVIKNAPYGPLAAPAQYKIGLYLQEKGMYQEARDEFEKVINDYPDSEWVKGAQYQIALVDAQRSSGAAYDQKVTAAATQEFADFVKEYPDAQLSENARAQIKQLREKEAENNFLIARFYEKSKNYKAARIYYKTVLSDFKDSSWAPQAAEKIQALDRKEQQ